jgi:hypothetical protein
MYYILIQITILLSKLDARLTGADPATSPVTGEYSTVELQPQ